MPYEVCPKAATATSMLLEAMQDVSHSLVTLGY